MSEPHFKISPYRILVVDDSKDSADSLALLLKLEHHEVKVCYKGPKSIEEARSFRPQVVVLDIGMPEMNGHQVARKIRELPGMKKVILFALTGYGQARDRKESIEAGFDYFFVKPCDPLQLLSLISSLDPPPVNAPFERPLNLHSIKERAQGCLRNHAYQTLKQIDCDLVDETLILRGRVSSYFLKQIAQEAVTQLEGVGSIDNQIQVANVN